MWRVWQHRPGPRMQLKTLVRNKNSAGFFRLVDWSVCFPEPGSGRFMVDGFLRVWSWPAGSHFLVPIRGCAEKTTSHHYDFHSKLGKCRGGFSSN